MKSNLEGIPGSDRFISAEPVLKGWSADHKFCVVDRQGQKMLLRLSGGSEYDRKQMEFQLMQQTWDMGVPMAQPLGFGRTRDGGSVYTLLGWCPGEDAEGILPSLDHQDQYELGLRSGQILQQIHRIPAPPEQEDWAVRFCRKVDRNISRYRECAISFPGDEKVLDYLNGNRQLLRARPQCFQHGDYHVGNMILTGDQKLQIIDFNRIDFGDPWEEFNRIVWSAQVSPHFATGQINGYFNGAPPEEFFPLLAFYIASNTLSSIPWAIPFGEAEITVMKNQATDVLTWFDGMRDPVPSWYLTKYQWGRDR